MGILDDAIREHLELKRKHGVDEKELQRQEEEALGPARRDVAQQHEDEAEPTGAAQDTSLFDGETPAAQVEPPPALSEESPPAVSEEPPALPEEHPAPERHLVDAHDLPDEEPVGEPGHDPESRDTLGDTEPHGFDAVEEDEEELEEEELEAEEEEGLLASDPDQAEQDVLEDTPDFLQETPEHDRLWFEQKPPRDFDFD